MLEFFKNLFNQPWIGALLGLIGILFGLFQIFRRQKGKLVYQTNTRRLIGSKYSNLPSNVKVLFNEKPVSSLSSSRIIIWNSGRSPIRKEDISSTDPLRIVLESGIEILEIEILSNTRDANQFKVPTQKSDESSIVFNFDFLDQNDGAVIEILHTGTSQNVKISGTLIGIPEGAKYLGTIPTDRSRYKKMLEHRKENKEDSKKTFGELISDSLMESLVLVFANIKLVAKIMFVISLGVLFYAIFPSITATFLPDFIEIPKAPESRIPLIIFGGIYLIFGFVFVWMERRRYPKELVLEND